jgi:hypothetical protein
MKVKKTKFDTHRWDEYLMNVNHCKVGVNMPAAHPSLGKGETEKVHGLPNYHRRRAFLVDEFPACPTNWLRSNGRTKSYFVPVIDGNALWLDFNKCLEDIPQHVAIVISVQGVNPVTGLPCKDAQLEQYKDECPKHKKPFGPDRLCKDCGHKWPKQNYIASTGTPEGWLWLDGFRAEDGVVRQYVLTKETARGVANAIAGENRVFALGISFFLSKEKRPERPVSSPRSESWGTKGLMVGSGLLGSPGPAGACGSPGVDVWVTDHSGPVDGLKYGHGSSHVTWGSSITDGALYEKSIENSTGKKETYEGKPSKAPPGSIMRSMSAKKSSGMKLSYTPESTPDKTPDKMCFMSMNAGVADMATDDIPVEEAAPVAVAAGPTSYGASINTVHVESMEVAAGARIDQQVYDDPQNLDYWQSEPEGIIVINYCSEAEAEAIIAQGRVDLKGSPEGFLKNVPTGNPV